MKKKVWDITVKDNPNRVVMGENDDFYTTDTEAYLVFNLEDKSFNPPFAVLTLENRNDGSLKNETVDVVDGLIEWEMPQRYIEHFGNWQGQLVYYDPKEGVSEDAPEEDKFETYTSATFTFVVNAHIGDKKKPSLVEIENWEKFIRDGTELIETWEDMEDLRQANEAQRQANYQELLDTGVLQTNINTKLEALEEEYAPKLTEVTTQLAQIESERLQSDFVDELKGVNYYDEIKIKKNSENDFEVSLTGPEVLQKMNFIAPDDYFKLSDVSITKKEFKQSEKNVQVSDFVFTGNWFEGEPHQTSYAREVGAFAEYTFETSSEGSISITTYVETRGGLMRATINGENPVEFSTFSETPTNKTVQLYNDLPSGVHILKIEFMGDDPNNTPSSGPGSSRGWLIAQTTGSGTSLYLLKINSTKYSFGEDVLTMSKTSNKEFAFRIAPANSENMEWVPWHGKKTAIHKNPLVLIMDGVSKSLNTLNSGEEYSCKKLQIKQDIYGRHPDSGNTDLINIKTMHTITLDGNIGVKGYMEVLEDINIDSSYVLMSPVNNALFDVLKTSTGQKYPATTTEYSVSNIEHFPKSYVFISSDSDYFVAFKHSDQRENMDLNGSALKRFHNFLEHRDETILKHYLNIFENQTLPKGYILNWSGDYITGYVI